jgi:2-amino-4-hydroxy-6-hydroxymethyldihydropteridine diphosphokinase
VLLVVVVTEQVVTEDVVIGLGSNLGDSRQLLAAAMVELRHFAAASLRVSTCWRTSPVACAPGTPDFHNAAVAFRPASGLSPAELIAGLQGIEAALVGGGPSAPNAPRALDLDLLLFADVCCEFPRQVPHPRALGRRFVLAPAAQVAPCSLWPGTGKTIARLNAELISAETVVDLGPFDLRQSC